MDIHKYIYSYIEFFVIYPIFNANKRHTKINIIKLICNRYNKKNYSINKWSVIIYINKLARNINNFFHALFLIV